MFFEKKNLFFQKFRSWIIHFQSIEYLAASLTAYISSFSAGIHIKAAANKNLHNKTC